MYGEVEAENLVRHLADEGSFPSSGTLVCTFHVGGGYAHVYMNADTNQSSVVWGPTNSLFVFDMSELYPTFESIDRFEKSETSPEDSLKCPQCDRTRPVQIESGELRCWWCEYTGSWHSFPKI